MDETKRPIRKREPGVRRVPIGTAVSPDLHDALTREAAEREISLSALAADVLAEKMGVPA